MSDLPKAVQAQLDAAEALQAQLANPAPEGNPEVTLVAETPVVQPVETVTQTTQVANQVPDENWEQRFRVIEGKYRAELPRLHEQNRELADRLDRALKALEDASKAPVQETKLVTDADVETYGSEMVDMVRRVSKEEGESLFKRLMVELETRFGAVAQKVTETEQTVVKTATDRFWEAVLKEHKDFDAVNDDSRWFSFLDKRVPGSRVTNRQLAEKAIKDLDAESLVEQVTLFKASLPQAKVEPTPTPKPNLNSQVAPNTSSASNPSSEPTGRVWTGAEYAAALDHRNLQRMTRPEYESLVAEAETALAEGRVRF